MGHRGGPQRTKAASDAYGAGAVKLRVAVKLEVTGPARERLRVERLGILEAQLQLR